MKLVAYQVKSNELSVQSDDLSGFRVGFLMGAYIVDLFLANQWLNENQPPSDKPASLDYSGNPVEVSSYDPSWLRWLEQSLQEETLVHLQIEGEPVALPIDEVAISFPFLPTRKMRIHDPDEGVFSPDGVMVHSGYFQLPQSCDQLHMTVSIGAMTGSLSAREWIGYGLVIRYQMDQEREIISLGSYLVTSDELENQVINLQTKMNGVLLDHRPIIPASSLPPYSSENSDVFACDMVVQPLFTHAIPVNPLTYIEVDGGELGTLKNTIGDYVSQ